MLDLKLFLAGVVVFAGFVSGLIIAKLTPEEFNDTSKYLRFIYITFLMVLLFLLFFSNNIILISLGSAFFIVGIALFEKRRNPALIYSFIALLLVSRTYPELSYALAFIAGIPIGVLMLNLSKKRFRQKILMTVISFIVILFGLSSF